MSAGADPAPQVDAVDFESWPWTCAVSFSSSSSRRSSSSSRRSSSSSSSCVVRHSAFHQRWLVSSASIVAIVSVLVLERLSAVEASPRRHSLPPARASPRQISFAELVEGTLLPPTDRRHPLHWQAQGEEFRPLTPMDCPLPWVCSCRLRPFWRQNLLRHRRHRRHHHRLPRHPRLHLPRHPRLHLPLVALFLPRKRVMEQFRPLPRRVSSLP